MASGQTSMEIMLLVVVAIISCACVCSTYVESVTNTWKTIHPEKIDAINVQELLNDPNTEKVLEINKISDNFDLNVNPTQGEYEFISELYTDVYYLIKNKNDIYVTADPATLITTDTPFIGLATKIQVRSKSDTEIFVDNIEIPANYQLYIISPKVAGDTFVYTLYKTQTDSSKGDIHLKIDADDIQNITVWITAVGNSGDPIQLY